MAPTGHYRFRRSFGNVGSRFRGARPDTYPLFSGILDQYAGASAAYSLRALSSAWLAGDVVEVRRSSDSTTQSFTANEVANGEMVDYVKRPGNFTNDGFETFTNNGTGDGFTATNTASFAIAKSGSVTGNSTDVVTVDFDITIVTGSPSISLRNAAGTIVSNLEVITTSGSKSIVLTATGPFVNFSFSEADIPAEFTISNVRFSTANGFVSTWYDQSGNGNDATQATTTSQPKIVDAGALVTGGLDFDGVDDVLGGSDLLLGSGSRSVFVVTKPNIISSNPIVNLRNSSITGGTYALTAEVATRCFGVTWVSSTPASTLSQNLLSAIYTSGNLFTGNSMSLNGNTVVRTSGTDGALADDTGGLFIGATNATTSEYDGAIEEVIIYKSDQTANRAGIETNINDHYSIY